METTKLYDIAERHNITVDRFGLPKCGSVSVWHNNRLFIALDSGINTRAEERVCLAHELGHCETLSFYNIYSPADIRAKHENHANRWAIQRLIPENRYRRALRNGYTYIHSLAEYFDVTDEFMTKAVEYYKNA